MALTEVREAHYVSPSGGSFTWDVALPTGTKVGDAVVVITNGSDGSSIGAVSSDQFHTTIAAMVGDPGTKFYFGKLTRLDPINVTVTTGSGTRSAHVQLLTLTGTLDMTRTSMNGATAGSVVVPALTGSSSGALALGVSWASIGGPAWNVPTGGATWNNQPYSAIYHLVGSAWTGDASITGPVTFDATVSNWVTGLLVGVGVSPTVAPPCRLIRDDDLGVGGSRLYPPPKSQQRSSRGVGYY